MDKIHQPLLALLLLGLTAISFNLQAADEFELIIESDSDELLIEEGLLIDGELSVNEELSISDELSVTDEFILDGLETQETLYQQPADAANSHPQYRSTPTSSIRASVDRIRLEYGRFESKSAADYQLYGHTRGKLNWQQGRWEMQAGARLDAYREHPDDASSTEMSAPNFALTKNNGNWRDVKLDYDDVFVRYRGEQGVFTVGTQKIIWGRIDEVPPTDRLSTHDLRRGMQDDLEDRRLASAAIRYEYFIGGGKVDAFYLPRLRAAELPDKNSVWYPINQRQGTILGLETTPLIESVVRTVAIDDDDPNTEGGFGLRFNQLGDGFDYAFAVQHGVGSLPYFSYNFDRNLVEVKYLRSTTLSGDIGMEALGGTLKLEAAWNSDTPITRADGRFDTTESVAWGVALELFPGDGDTRLNLQLVGNYLLNAPEVLDRDKMASVNGSLEWPFANNNWRARLRFNVGLDMTDLYFNPELTYTGFNNHEIYVELHEYSGDTGSIGGFYEDSSSINLGWRITL